MPAAVAVPRDEEDVAALVRWSRDEGIALVPRGSGSSMAGGAIGPGAVMDLSRLRPATELRVEERTVVTGVGAVRDEVDARAREVGLRFPVDPSSGAFATIGGMVATNAAGPRSLRHGPMRPWVRALRCVFEDGTIATLRRGKPVGPVDALVRFDRDAKPGLLQEDAGFGALPVLKNASGYAVTEFLSSGDAIDLLVGSEGTLALFTEVELSLIPVSAATVMLLAYDDLESAARGAIHCRDLGASACELLDRTLLEIAAAGGHRVPAPASAEAVLVVEVEEETMAGATAAAHALLASVRRHCPPAESVLAGDSVQELELWGLRHAASPAIARLDPRLRSMQFIEDAAVPPERLGDYVRGVRTILAAEGVRGAIFGHAGDAHVHVNPLIDVSAPGWRGQVERILLDVTGLVARLGGTLSGEHGDGRLRTPLLNRIWSPAAMQRFADIKRAFDPRNLLNPGVKVALPDQRAVDLVKYDPELPPHSPAVRRALEVVESERAYARFRLSMLGH